MKTLNKTWRLSKNKAFEYQIDIGTIPNLRIGGWLTLNNNTINTSVDIFNIIGFLFKLNRREDHAGFMLNINLPFLFFSINYYDNRHWDYDNDTWEVYP